MNVQDAMTSSVVTCNKDDSLSVAAQLMWENDCGAIPVLGYRGAVAGMITDRDVCMAAYTKGVRLEEIPVHKAMSELIHTCKADDDLERALAVMRKAKVRRIPVTRDGRAIGMLSLSDVMTVLRAPELSRIGGIVGALFETLVAVSQPRVEAGSKPDSRVGVRAGAIGGAL